VRKIHLFSIAIVSLAVGCTATKQNKTIVETPAAAPAAPLLKNKADSACYSIGLSIARNLKSNGFDKIDISLLQKALEDEYANKPSLLTEQQMNMCITDYMQTQKEEKIAANKAAGEKFLAENKKKPGVVTLPSGLQYEVIRAGTGTEHPTMSSSLKCHYHGTTLEGVVFDSSVEKGTPITFQLGSMIQGWQEAFPLMTAGSKWRLFVPPALAYGDNGAGPKIGPGSTLIFEVELLEVNK
jgi:FKBP-type peptidyl-prolyl cis-trans isomerase FklB